ncbi:MAG TPA: anti-sigma factor [Ramlibacter sp.]|nr:anti-sigma factor [Ramlibacter sp.]
MNLLDHPELADRLAAAYGLGTLRGGARRRFEAQARKSPALRAAALAWQERFAAMTELQPGEAPSPNVWKRIQLELAQHRPTGAGAQTPARALRRWRVATYAGVLTAFSALGVSVYLGGEIQQRETQLAEIDRARNVLSQQNVRLAAQLQAQPQIQYVAVLTDDRSAASMLVTFDPRQNTLTLKRLGAYQEGPEKSLQLWALPPQGGPRSLGVLGADAVVKLTAAENQVRAVPALAVSLEPKGGVPGERGPTGPVLFKGPLLQTP